MLIFMFVYTLFVLALPIEATTKKFSLGAPSPRVPRPAPIRSAARVNSGAHTPTCKTGGAVGKT